MQRRGAPAPGHAASAPDESPPTSPDKRGDVFTDMSVAASAAGVFARNDKQRRRAVRAAMAIGESHDGDFGIYMAHKDRKLHIQQDALPGLGALAHASAAGAGGPAPEGAHGAAPDAGSTAPAAAPVFRGVRVHVNGRTHPSNEEIRCLMALHGGVYEQHYSSLVTHIVATNLPVAKVKEHRYVLGRAPTVMWGPRRGNRAVLPTDTQLAWSMGAPLTLPPPHLPAWCC